MSSCFWLVSSVFVSVQLYVLFDKFKCPYKERALLLRSEKNIGKAGKTVLIKFKQKVSRDNNINVRQTKFKAGGKKYAFKIKGALHNGNNHC